MSNPPGLDGDHKNHPAAPEGIDPSWRFQTLFRDCRLAKSFGIGHLAAVGGDLGMKNRNTFQQWLLGFVLISCAFPARGAGFVPTRFVPPQNPQRYIFIVEKSDHTQAEGLNLSQTMFDLVYHGANGYLPDGGVFEIWVFGEKTIYRGFNPEMLMPGNHLPLASKASAFVRTANSGGPPDVAAMIEKMHGAGELAIELTIILVTSPETRLTGTRIDSEVNAYFEANEAAQIEAKRPFITTMRIQDGKIVDWKVNDSTFTMSMPLMPTSPLPLGERERMVDEARKAHFAKEHPKPPPTTQPSPQPGNNDLPDEKREGAIILRGNPSNESSTAANTAASETTTPPSPTTTTQSSTAAPNSKSATTPGPAEKSVERPSAPPPANIVAESKSKPAGSPTVTPSTKPPATVVETNPVPAVAKSGPVKTVSSNAPPPGGSEVQAGPHEVVATNKAAAGPTHPAAPTNAPPENAVVIPPRTWFTVSGLFVAGICFFVVAALLAWVLMRRTRSAAGPSYITRSIEDRRK